MKDERIRHRAAERDALVEHGVKVLCLTSSNLRATEMDAPFLAVIEQIADACAQPRAVLVRSLRSWASTS